jgi:hypothetical protein
MDWHFSKQSRACALIYALASRVTAKKGWIFYASAAKVASFLGLSKDTVYRAIRALRKLGFFEFLGKTKYGTNRYRVHSHEEWAEKHPEQCAVYHRDSEADFTEPSSEMVQPGEPDAGAEVEFASGDRITQSKMQDSSCKANAIPVEAPHIPPRGTRQSGALEQQARDTTSVLAAHPEVRALARDLTFTSGGQITFRDKERARLTEVLKEFSAAEIRSVFSAWVADQDLDDPKNVQYLPGKFVEIVDSLAYTARRKKQEAERERIVRAAAVKRLLEEAEDERRLAEEKKRAEAEIFDPLA